MKTKTKRTRMLKIDQLIRDPALQMRENIEADPENFARLLEMVSDGEMPPPCEVVSDGRAHWLTDGYLRTAVLEKAGKSSVECLILPGTFLDARMRALRANAGNGSGRTDGDRRKAVNAILDSPELLEKARNEFGCGILAAVAKACGVSSCTVSRSMESRGEQIHNGKIVPRRTREKPNQDEILSTCEVEDDCQNIDNDDDPPEPSLTVVGHHCSGCNGHRQHFIRVEMTGGKATRHMECSICGNRSILGIACPRCTGCRFITMATRHRGDATVRVRRCLNEKCGHRFRTKEVMHSASA